jgi:sec-independent protein translocase protein TatB
MFGMGMPEIILILAIALIVLGPKKLPEIAKALGRGIAEFKKATQDFKESLDVEDDLKEARDTMRGIKGDLQQTIQKSVAKGAASVDNDNESDEDDDAMPAKDLEPPSEKAVEETPKEPVEDQSAPQAEKKAEAKEPSRDA